MSDQRRAAAAAPKSGADQNTSTVRRSSRLSRAMRASLLGAAAIGASGCVSRTRARITPPPPQTASAARDEDTPWRIEPTVEPVSPQTPPPSAAVETETSPPAPPAPRTPPRPAAVHETLAPPEPPDGRNTYELLPEVSLSPEVKSKVAQIAESYHRRTGKRLVLTSGTRDVARQAEAMYELLRLGAELSRIYKNRAAAREITAAYQAACDKGLGPRAVMDALAEVVRAQMDRGVYVSAHLRAGAVDVRSRGMSPADKRAFVAGVEEVGGAEVIEESTPPHFHLELE